MLTQLAGNYRGIISGNYWTSDSDAIKISRPTVVDLLEAKGISWTTYQEDYPGNATHCFQKSKGLYQRKHNPFMSFNNIRKNSRRCAHIQNADKLDEALAAHTQQEMDNPRQIENVIPQFVFYTPNMDNNGHDTNAAFAGDYLQSLVRKYNHPAFKKLRTLFVVTFDEDSDHWSKAYLHSYFPKYFSKKDNRVFTVIWGEDVIPKESQGTKDGEYYSHYSILKTIEENWDLGDLEQNDVGATAFAL